MLIISCFLFVPLMKTNHSERFYLSERPYVHTGSKGSNRVELRAPTERTLLTLSNIRC